MTDKDKECRSQREAFDAWIFQRGVSGEKLTVAEEAFQAGATWQQSRLMDEDLVERVALAMLNGLRLSRGVTEQVSSLDEMMTSDKEAYLAEAKAAIAEIKKHMEGV